MTHSLKPFWRYYGGKWRAAPKYPKPQYDTIIEPFAGAAGYSLRYPDRQVILIEKYAVLAEMWRYLIGVKSAEVRRIPTVDHVDELPAWVPEGARSLVGFSLNSATTRPSKSMSSGQQWLRSRGRKYEGWGEGRRELVARQVSLIKHWRIIEGDYTGAPDVDATWFVDPPYNNSAGRFYVHADLDYAALGLWCRSRSGQTIVCENAGADWLPFRPFMNFKKNEMTGKTSSEVIWTND